MDKVLVLSVGKNNSLELNHAQNEFTMLLKEVNYEPISYFSQNIDTVDKATYVGVGKLYEVSSFYHQYNEEHPEDPVVLVACNFELSVLEKNALFATLETATRDRKSVV